jgi:hypothetical protein
MDLNEIVQDSERWDELHLYAQGVFRGQHQNTESPLEEPKDPLDVVPQLGMSIVEQFPVVLRPIEQKYIQLPMNDDAYIPLLSLTPLLKMVARTPIRDQQRGRVGIASVAQVVSTLGNKKAICLRIFKDVAVRSASFPSRENIDELEIKVTGCQDILRELVLPIAICSATSLGNVSGYMCPIQSTDTFPKILREARRGVYLGWDRCITSG